MSEKPVCELTRAMRIPGACVRAIVQDALLAAGQISTAHRWNQLYHTEGQKYQEGWIAAHSQHHNPQFYQFLSDEFARHMILLAFDFVEVR